MRPWKTSSRRPWRRSCPSRRRPPQRPWPLLAHFETDDAAAVETVAVVKARHALHVVGSPR